MSFYNPETSGDFGIEWISKKRWFDLCVHSTLVHYFCFSILVKSQMHTSEQLKFQILRLQQRSSSAETLNSSTP